MAKKEAHTTNSTYTQGGVSAPLDSFVVIENSVLRINFCTKKPALRVAAKRYNNLFKNTNTIKKELRKNQLVLLIKILFSQPKSYLH